MGEDPPSPALVLVTKAPDPARAKTRMRPLPDAVRGALAEAMIRDTLDLALALPGARVVVACDPGPDHPFFRSLRARLTPQPAGSLGARLSQLLAAEARGSAGVLFLGSDCPHLPPDTLAAAAAAMAAGSPWDGVMAPADDGGYVLIGLKRGAGALLDDIPWSTAAVAETTRRRAREAGLRLLEIAPSFDLDTPADLARLLAATSLSVAPHTRRFLQGIRALLPAEG